MTRTPLRRVPNTSPRGPGVVRHTSFVTTMNGHEIRIKRLRPIQIDRLDFEWPRVLWEMLRPGQEFGSLHDTRREALRAASLWAAKRDAA